MSKEFRHQSVMPQEIMSFFINAHGKTLIDATAGGGGHLLLLAQAVGPQGMVYGFDKDPRAIQDDAALGVAKRYRDRVKLFNLPFSQIKKTLQREGVEKVDGVLCDLGVSSNQLDDGTRGFSLKQDGPIDMRMDPSSGLTAYRWLERSSEKEIADTLYNYGDERKSRAIAKMLKQTWPIEDSTLALAHLVTAALKQRSWSKIHPATRTFQAIRMAVNDEVGELTALLSDLSSIMAVGGVCVFLSFHSIEDRLIKTAFKEICATAEGKGPIFKILTKKPITATASEQEANRRSRSAKLRAMVRIS